VELNLAQPAALEGFHDIYTPADPPGARAHSPASPGGRIGGTAIPCPADKIAAVVVTNAPDKPRPLAKPDENSRSSPRTSWDFSRPSAPPAGSPPGPVPLQSGVGSVANAVLAGLKDSSFEHLSFYSEVMQDAVLELMDCGKADFCSATSLSLSAGRHGEAAG
jgi:succinyl-CoA:acetate CoA-transferase